MNFLRLILGRNRGLEGHFDGVFGRLATGWVYDRAEPGRVQIVEIYSGNRLIAEGPANLLREDLVVSKVGTGCCGFSCLLPIELFDGNPHSVWARVKGRTSLIPGGPHLLAKVLPTLADAFNEADVVAAPPLNDFQVTLLRGLSAVSELLAAQAKVLSRQAAREELPTAVDTDPDIHSKSPISATRKSTALDEIFLSSKSRLGDIVIFPIIDWDFRVQRPQHLATNLARLGYRVTYLSINFDELLEGRPRYRIRDKKAEGVFEIILSCPFPHPNIYAGIYDAENLRHLANAINELIDGLGLVFPTAIVHFPTWLPVVNSISGTAIVFDCLDHLAGFSTTSPEVVALEKELVCCADAVVTSSSYLHEQVAELRESTIVRNGAEVDFFSTEPIVRADFGCAPVIGYYGAIAEWFDIDLVYHVATSRPEWRIVLVGSTAGAEIEKLKDLPNIDLVGEVPYRRITEYLYTFDCCLIPFKVVELIKATNPVKIYEYFAAGKPVVATRIPELELVPRDLVRLADGEEDFLSQISLALSEDQDLSLKRKLWATNHSWMKRGHAFARCLDAITPCVSVIILCFNNVAFTRAALRSVAKFSDYANLEVICVDNASTDETPEFLDAWAKEHQNVTVIINDTNLGFAAGNNVGIKHAKGDIIILLNNDTFVTKGWVRDLIRPLLQNPAYGMVGPITNMIGNEQKIKINYANMEEMAAAARAFTRQHRHKLFDTENLAFFCVAIHRRVIETVGLLAEEYGIGFFEDDDYCRRATQAGFKLAVVDDVFVHHHLSGSFDKDPVQKKSLMEQNKKIFETKWGPWKPHGYRNSPGFGD